MEKGTGDETASVPCKKKNKAAEEHSGVHRAARPGGSVGWRLDDEGGFTGGGGVVFRVDVDGVSECTQSPTSTPRNVGPLHEAKPTRGGRRAQKQSTRLGDSKSI